MNLGPATDAVQPPQETPDDEFGEETTIDDDWDEQIAVVPEVVPEEPKVDPKLERVATLVLQVNEFMKGNDVHRHWRRYLARGSHRHLNYDCWPQPLQAEFDTLFKGYLSDAQFVSSICRKVYDMDGGKVVGVKSVVSFLIASAGFTAFTLIGID